MNNRYKYLSLSIIAISCITIITQCSVDETQQLVKRNYQLVWSDEFEGGLGTKPDATKWTFDIGTGDNGWGNNEFQYYTNRPENVGLDGKGNLAITARDQAFSGSSFSSARIKTKGLYSQVYGRIEARIKTPYGPGIWPAFWMLGDNIDQVKWPQCGEIDIMELRGQEPNIIAGTIHGPGYSGGNPISKYYGFTNKRFDTDFHVFAIEWGEEYVDFFVDEILYSRVTPQNVPGEWVFNKPFYILLNVAVGGNYVGFPTSQTPFPQTMTIDYVRAYKEIK
jgi:beta-glucanase (GH16 family)